MKSRKLIKSGRRQSIIYALRSFSGPMLITISQAILAIWRGSIVSKWYRTFSQFFLSLSLVVISKSFRYETRMASIFWAEYFLEQVWAIHHQNRIKVLSFSLAAIDKNPRNLFQVKIIFNLKNCQINNFFISQFFEVNSCRPSFTFLASTHLHFSGFRFAFAIDLKTRWNSREIWFESFMLRCLRYIFNLEFWKIYCKWKWKSQKI